MLIIKTLTVQPGSTEADPSAATVELPKGILYKVEALFPAGCMYLVKCSVWYGLEKIFPWHESEDVAGNGETIADILDWDLPDNPTRLQLRCYCPTCNYKHNITFRFYVYEAKSTLSRLLYSLVRALGIRL